MKPFFSIIIPVFNCSSFIETVLNSIYGQTYENFELIIYDDLSTDNSVQLIKSWLKGKSIKSKLIISKENFGAAYGLNECLKEAKGDFIVFGAHDNIFHASRLKNLHDVIENLPDVKFITHDAYSGFYEQFKKSIGNKVVGAAKYLDINFKSIILFRSTLFQFDSFIIKHELVGNYSQYIKYSPTEDLALVLHINELYKKNMMHLSEPLFYKIKSYKSQTYTHAVPVRKSSKILLQKKALNNFYVKIAITSIDLISWFRANNFLFIMRNFIFHPVIFLCAIFIITIRFVFYFITTKSVNIPNDFFVDTKR